MPKNLSSEDLPLFEHEEIRRIKSSYFFERSSVFIFNSIVLSFRGLTYFKNYTFFGDKTFLERIKRIVKAYKVTNKNRKVVLEREYGLQTIKAMFIFIGYLIRCREPC